MDKDIIVLTSEPAQGKTVGDVRLWVETHSGENNLAKAIALVSNQVGWLCHETDDHESESAKQKALGNVNEWDDLYNELIKNVLEIYPLENNGIKTGTHYQISPFMKKHGFEDANGWWIPREELENGNK